MRVLPLDFPDWAALARFLIKGQRGAQWLGPPPWPRLGEFVLLEVRVEGTPREYLRGRVSAMVGEPTDPEWMRGVEVHYLRGEAEKMDYLRRVAYGDLPLTRREARLPIRLPAEVRIPPHPDAEPFDALAEDIGRWGAFLRTTLATPIGSMAWVVIRSSELGTLSVQARVAWVSPRGLGVAFVPHNETDCGLIVDWVDQLNELMRATPDEFSIVDEDEV